MSGFASRTRTIAAAIAVVAGLTLLAAAALTPGRPAPADFGVISASPTAVASTQPARPIRPSIGANPSRRPAPTGVVPAVPVALTIPAIGVRAEVQPVGTSRSELEVPSDPAQVGWWTGSALVGSARGTVLIDGHVDSAASGPGALFRLTDLRSSDRILVATGRHQQQTYLVTGRRLYVKADGLPPDLFTSIGPPRLVLITCGGPFDRATGNYLDNVVLFATST